MATTSNETPFTHQAWYARSVEHLPERLKNKVVCVCGEEWFDAYRSVASMEIVRLREIINILEGKLREAQGSSPAS